MDEFKKSLKQLILVLADEKCFELATKEMELVNHTLKKNWELFIEKGKDDDEGELMGDIRTALDFYKFVKVSKDECEISEAAEEFLATDDKPFFLATYTFNKKLKGSKYPEDIIAALKVFTSLSSNEQEDIRLVNRAGYEIEFEEVPKKCYNTSNDLRNKVMTITGKETVGASNLFRLTRYGVKEIYDYDVVVLKKVLSEYVLRSKGLLKSNH